MADYGRQLETALNAAARAGEMLREEFHRAGGPRGEGGHAEIDEIAEAEIHRILSGAWPQYGYRGEELGFKGGPRDSGRHTWVVDPNDGTSDFLRGFRGSSVAIALLRAGHPVLGVVYAYCAPDSAGDLISWAEGCGPVRRNGAATQRSWPDRVTEDSTVLVSTYADFKIELNARAVAPMRFRGTPSIAYRMAMMAVGDADATVSLNAPHSWDYAAGHALLMGAGANLAGACGGAITYTDDGESDCGGACYAGSEALIWELLDRDWMGVRRGLRDRTTPFVLPVRGRAIRDPGLLSRAQGALIGQLAAACAPGALAGQPTGESELALELARSIVRCGRYDPEQAARAYIAWHRSNPIEIGAATRTALAKANAAIAAGTPALEACRTSGDAAAETHEALLRMTPIGIAFEPDEAWSAAYEDAALTHPNERARSEAALFARTLSHMIRTGESAEAIPGASGPIFAALSGALHGLRGLPQRSVDRVLTARPIAGLAGVRHPRPPDCWAIDALYLAERLLTDPSAARGRPPHF